jgi:hypothetical protein
MIQVGMIYHLQNRMNSACLGIIGTKHHATDARMNRRSRAHGAWFNRCKQFTVSESVIA